MIGRGGAKVTCVEATWTQPKVTCGTKDQRFSISIGIDGWTSTEMHVKAPRSVKVGTEAGCSGGTLTSSAWHAASPDEYFDTLFRLTTLSPAVGDVIWAQIRYANGVFTMALRDKTTGEQVSITQVVARISRVTARWSVSSVDIDCTTKCRSTTLPRFSPIAFTSAEATLNGTLVAVGRASIIDVVQGTTKSGVKRLVISKIGSGGRSFTVTWKHA